MSKGSSFFAFLAGAAAGAFLALFKTEEGRKIAKDIKAKGEEIYEDGRAAVLNGLDKVEEALERRQEEAAEVWEQPIDDDDNVVRRDDPESPEDHV